ncbi:MAG TPA: hypothetical protein VGM39_06075 [Kofleriaceae bacterium]|jgi:predicted esterase
MFAHSRWFVLCAALGAACGGGDDSSTGDDGGNGAVHPLFDLTASSKETFYDLPYPNDLYRTANGLDLTNFPTNALIADSFRMAAQELDGFGLNSAMFVRFSGALDAASLPDVNASITDAASVYVVNVTPTSPDYGKKSPVVVRFRTEGTQTLGDNNLVVRPYPGFPLAEATQYALVVTTRVQAGGAAIAVAPSYADVAGSGGDAMAAKLRTIDAPLFTWLDAAGGDERADIAAASVFTTQHASIVPPALRKAIFALPAPTATNIVSTGMTATYQSFTGSYMAPNFQSGDVPYKTAGSGKITVGTDGAAVVSHMETLRFALTVPIGAVPTNGWPICIYSHGTGGNYQSFIGEGVAGDLAQQGIAVISMDQVLHGPRNPNGDPELDFFNFANPYAARDNALQGAADAWSQMRLALGLSIANGGKTHTFDGSKVFFFGHSQGGITGPGFVTFEPKLKGAILSGTAGLLYENILHKTMPLDIPALVETFIRDEPVDEDNPTLGLVQMWLDRSDSVNFAPLMTRNPVTVDGVQNAPRNIFQTEGFTDTYAPNIGLEAFATALGGDIVDEPDKKPVEGVTLRGRTTKPAPISGNLNGATAVLAQFNMQPGSDGHFVVFDIQRAKTQADSFLGTLSSTGTATVIAP